ncbi:MAG: polymerase-binding protein DksA [Pseudomonadota bacterium]|jgi:DnaK suppressor protein
MDVCIGMVTKTGNQKKATKTKTSRVVARKSGTKVSPKKPLSAMKKSVASKTSPRPTKTSIKTKKTVNKKGITINTKSSVIKKNKATQKKSVAQSSTPKSKSVLSKKSTPSKITKPPLPKVKTGIKKPVSAPVAPKVKKMAPVKEKRVLEKESSASKKAKPTHIKKTSSVTEKSVSANREFIPYRFEPYSPLKGEHYMSDQQLSHFRQILNAWKLELMREVDNTISGMKASSADVLADLNDRATQEEAFNLELRTRDRERKLLKKIEDALQQIDEKEYGYCESCGIEIGIRRLEARPTAALCIDCKTLAEIREKRVAQ